MFGNKISYINRRRHGIDWKLVYIPESSGDCMSDNQPIGLAIVDPKRPPAIDRAPVIFLPFYNVA